MEKALKVTCENCGAVIYLTRDADGSIIQETVKPPKKEMPKDEKEQKGANDDWF